MDILHTFGFDWKLFIAQVVNFLILFVIFKKFLYKPILGILKEREARIRQGLEDAEKTKAVLEATAREREEILKRSRVEAQEIIENTRRIAEELRAEILEKSRADSEKVVAQARTQAEAEMKQMEKQVKVMSLDLSQKILINVLGTLFTDQEKERVMKRALESMEKDRGTLS